MRPKAYSAILGRARVKRHKYGAKGGYYCMSCFQPRPKPDKKDRSCSCGGTVAYYGSKLEQRYWVKLKLMEKAGAIVHLKHQVRYPIIINGRRVGTYIADFTFYDKHDKKVRVLDAKGQEIEATRFRRKCAEACNDIEVEIVR